MTWFTPEVAVTLCVIVVVLLFAGFSALAQYRQRIQRALEIAERLGLKIRTFKDHRLSAWVNHLPFSADTMTVLRLIATVISLDAFVHDKTTLALSAFIVAWLFDLFDGLKARAELLERGYPTPWGKYFDPGIDLICFLATAVVLADWYPRWLIGSFTAMIGMRMMLFLIILLGRLMSRHWHDRLSSNILPESIAGKFKTVFIALSFGLIILNRSSAPILSWAWWLLGIALTLELLSLIQQGCRVRRILFARPQLQVVEPQRKTGSD